jgi:hypothetical protein
VEKKPVDLKAVSSEGGDDEKTESYLVPILWY